MPTDDRDWVPMEAKKTLRVAIAPLDRLEAERDQARAWAKAWKRAAKLNRSMAHWLESKLYANTYAGALKSEKDRLEVENRRYREALTRISSDDGPPEGLYYDELYAWAQQEAHNALKGESDAG